MKDKLYTEEELESMFNEIKNIDDEFLQYYIPEKNRGEPIKFENT